MTLIEIGIPQISGGCPYKVVNSQWLTTRPEAMWKTKILERQKGTWQCYMYNMLVCHDGIKNCMTTYYQKGTLIYYSNHCKYLIAMKLAFRLHQSTRRSYVKLELLMYTHEEVHRNRPSQLCYVWVLQEHMYDPWSSIKVLTSKKNLCQNSRRFLMVNLDILWVAGWTSCYSFSGYAMYLTQL